MKTARLLLTYLLATIGLLTPNGIFADEIDVADANGNVLHYTFTGTDGSATLASLTSVSTDAAKAGHVVVPTSVTDGDGNVHGVTVIGERAFQNSTDLVDIFIPNSLLTIGSYAFQGCTALRQVVFEDDPEKDPEDTSQSLPSWTSDNQGSHSSSTEYEWTITVKAGDVLSFAYRVSSESNYDWLTITLDGEQIVRISGEQSDVFTRTFTTAATVTLKAVYSKDGSANSGDDTGEVYNVGVNLVKGGNLRLGSNGSSPLFADCPLDSVYVGRLLEYQKSSSTGYSPFYNNTSLRAIDFGKTANSISTREFYGCKSLANVVLGEGCTRIDTYAFADCDALHSIVLPDAVTNVYAYAFQGCDNLVSVAMGSGIAVLGDHAFYECKALTSVTGGENLGLISAYCFSQTALTEAFVPAGVTEIGQYAFSGCTAMTSATIPNRVTSIGNYAFQSCTALAQLTIEDAADISGLEQQTLENWTSTNGGQHSTSSQHEWTISVKAGDLLSFGYRVSSESCCDKLIVTLDGTEVVNVGGEVSSVFYKTFAADATVTLVAKYSKDGSVNTGDDLGELYEVGVNLRRSGLTLGSNGGSPLFVNCPLDSVYVGRDLLYNTSSSNGYSPFYRNTSLRAIHLSDEVREVTPYEFAGCTALESARIGDKANRIGSYAFQGCDKLRTVSIPNSVKAIGTYAFQSCDSLRTVHIGSGVTTISTYTFNECKALREVTGGENVTTIGEYAFYQCQSLESFDCHDKVTVLNSYAFAYCGKLKELKGLKAVTTVNTYALYCDYALTELEMGEALTSWNYQSGYSSSYILSNLLKITLPGETIPFTSSNSTYGLPSGLTLYVPADMVDAYKTNDYTKNYRIIPIGAISDFAITTDAGGQLQERLIEANITPEAALELTITGPINGTDIDYIHRYLVNLQTLDIENARIVSGGESYHRYTVSSNGTVTLNNSYSYNTENDIVGNSMFAYMTKLQRLVLPNTVTKIYGYAFSDCSQLSEVIIPETVDSIGSYAFTYNSISSSSNRITSLTLPSKLKQINPYTFRYMRSLQSIVLPDSVKSIGTYAFYDCDALRTVQMGNKVTSIGERAFYDCDALRTINLSEALDTLGTYAFYSCDYLTDPITIPAGIRTMPEYAFRDCTRLQGVTFNEGLTHIGNLAFYNCDGLTELSFPQSLNYIGSESFRNCDGLTTVTLPTQMKTLYNYAFNSCTKLTSVTMPTTLGSMGTNVFAGCTSLPNITLPETITFIPNSTFQGCTSLTDVQLSSQTRRIGESVFSGCTSLTAFDFDQYTKLNQVYGYSFENSGLIEVDLPNRIDTLYSYAFRNCKSLVRAKMPTGVDYVASYLFYNCPKLTEVIMHNGINRINSYAFSYCTTLPTIELNDNIATIGTHAFSYCDSLQLAKLPDNLTTINEYAFYHCDTLALATLPSGLKTISNYAFGYCRDLKLETVPAGVTTLGNYTFEYSGIKKMTLPTGITSWGNALFYECDSLQQVTWPDDKTIVPESTFYGCGKLNDITLPDAVTIIKSNAFYECRALTSFHFPASLTTIENYAFRRTSGMPEVELPISLRTIGNYAFQGSGLTHIEIPDSVQSLGEYAFQASYELRSAVLGRSMSYSGNSYFNYFNGCDSLQTLRIYAGVPPTLNSNSYVSAYYKNCVLEVPAGVDSIYRATNIWKDFKEIRTFLTGDKLAPLDYAIMKAIYNQLDGENWTNKWDLTTDDRFVNKWYGVTTEGDHIVKINMNGNNMRGELPDSLFLLPELRELDMGNAYITGDLTTLLPDEYQNGKITRIQLYANELEGDAYPFISKFPNLKYLSLAYNRLTAMSQPYTKANITSVGNGFWLTDQFMDYKTHEPVVTEKYPAQEITLGVPFNTEWNSLQLYDHGSQNYNRGTGYLFRVYWNSSNNLDYGSGSYAYFYKKDDGTYDIRARVFSLPKNSPVALYPYSGNYGGSSYLDTPSIFTINWIDGDVNADQSVDVVDLQKVIYYALNDAAPSNTFYNYTSADGNSDNALDVRDAVINVNRILDFDEASAPSPIRALYNKERSEARNHFAIEGGTVRMANGDEVAAIQLTLANALAEDITLSPTLAGFRMAKKQIGQNVRVVIYSVTEQTLPEGLWDIVRGMGDETYLMNVRLSDVETNHLDASICERVTGIDSMDNGQLTIDNEEVYDLSGRKVTNPQKNGVYIVNGKKSIIK
ncbi:MAG: leucine-rich repeat protein [Bacteroidaceae bacterium]|nr:leucine-rich repeat protein [Bacteroidaceae bacterium]